MRALIPLSSNIERATPLLVMGVLTLISFSLLKSAPSSSYSNQAEPTRTGYDYYVDQFSSAQINASGHLISLVRGRHALHSLVEKNILVEDFLFTSNSTSSLYLGRAELAKLDDDGNNLVMKNNAVLDRKTLQPQSTNTVTRLRSNHLQLSQYPERLISNTFTQIEQNNRKLHAQSMQYDYDEQKMRLLGGVRIKVDVKK
jgi:LPS export ABC transporter protein LptC